MQYLKNILFSLLILSCLTLVSVGPALGINVPKEKIQDTVEKSKGAYTRFINGVDGMILDYRNTAPPHIQKFLNKYYTRTHLQIVLWLLVIFVIGWAIMDNVVNRFRTTQKRGPRSNRSMKKEAQTLSKKGMHMQAGDLYKQLKMQKEALKEYLEAEAWHRAGDIYRDWGDLDNAARMYEKAGSFSIAADMFVKAKRFEMAEQMYMKDNRETLVGEMWEKLGQWKRAGKAYENCGYFMRAAEMYAKAEEHAKAGQMFETAFMEKAGGRGGAEEMDATARQFILNAGQHYAKAGNITKAADALSKGGMYLEAANLYMKLKDFNRAALYYQKADAGDKAAAAFEQVGDRVTAARFRGEALLRDGKYGTAADAFALAQDYQQAADLYMRAEDWGKAAINYEKSSDFESAAEMFLRNGQFDKAGEVYEKCNQFENAAAMWEKAANYKRQARNLIELKDFFRAGKILYENGEIDEALQIFQQVPPESPDYFDTSVAVGELFMQKKMFPLALKKFREIIGDSAITLRNVEAYYSIALLLEGSGNLSEALKIYESILSVNFNFRDVQDRIKQLQTKGITPASGSAALIISQPSTTEIESAKVPDASLQQLMGTLASPGDQGPLTFSPPTDGGSTKVVNGTAQRTSAQPRFLMLEELGRGGMGIVFKAKDTILNRIVAYKVLTSNLKNDKWALETFLREARAAAALNHPNIIHVYDASQDERDVFIVMEFVDGTNLKDLLKKRGIMKVQALAVIFRQVCAALGYAHSQKVIHRDIKPSNIMLTRNRQVKIADFGLAKVLTEFRDSQTMISGTPYYMAPEQIMGGDVTHLADIYSLGVTLFEMATGSVPFPSGEVNYHHVHTPPPDPKNLNPEISDELRDIILKCLEKKPEKRYQSMHDIQKDLKALAAAI